MDDLIRELRSSIELQRRFFGDFFFPADGSPEAASGAAVTRSEPDGDVASTRTDNEMADQQLFETSETDVAEEPTATPYNRIEALIPKGHPALEVSSLEALEALVREMLVLPIDHQRLNPVFGVGNNAADLMLVGEAPGADEDRQGEPFVGRAGMLLNKILAAIGFERSDVYIANILKSRPPGNRTPLAEEIEAHIPFLYKQIALIRPRVLLSLGLCSSNALLEQKASLGSMRGRFHDFHGLPLMVTYHPAALLRNPEWKRPTWEDVQLLRKKYDELAGDRT